ncbi:MAG: GAF domain-containing protein [Gammaproteobacteria bacterium]|nr:GAF domain-containing protein [Gammaproteobacteria bacterium]MCP5196430.1 GAF domain-containing protein [Gammaproteobacteria bacterium]
MLIEKSCDEAESALNPLGDLHELAVFLNAEDDLESRLDELARLAARATAAASCSIMLSMDNESEIPYLKLWACTEKLPAEAWGDDQPDHGASIANRVLEHGKPMLITDIQTSEFASLARHRTSIGFSFISTPIQSGQQTVGVLNLSSRPDAPSFGDADLILANIVAALIGRSVQVAWLRKLVRSRIAQTALARQGEQAARRLTDGSLPPSRLAKLLAKSFYKDLTTAGFSAGQIIEAASEIIGQISGGLTRHKKRMERETVES